MVRAVYFLLILMFTAVSSQAGEGSRLVAKADDDRSGLKDSRAHPPVVHEKYDYYEVCGCCEKDVVCDLKKKCITSTDGNKYDSITNWKVKWDYGHSRVSGACTTDSFTVTVDVTFHLPKMKRTDATPRPLAEKWDRYVANLMKHEKGHRDRAVAAAEDLTRTIAGLSPFRACSELDRTVNTLSRARMDTLIKEQAAYDTKTDHGALQGVVFP